MVKKRQRGRPVSTQLDLIRNLQLVRVSVGDVLVLNLPESWNQDRHRYIQEIFIKLFPVNKLLILDGGKTIGVLSAQSSVNLGVKNGTN